MSMWLDRETGVKCYMLSARNLFIVWGDTPEYWTWIPLDDSSRFSEAAQLMGVCWFEIRGKIHSSMLSQDTTYAAYMVFKTTDDFDGLDYPVQEASISAGATNVTRRVCLQCNDDEEDDDGVPENYRPISLFPQPRLRRRNGRIVSHEENVTFPQERDDGWMELELGEFFIEGGDDGDVSLSLMETKGGNWKSGLIVQGIEIRRKKSG
jgi:hypothetical protein